MAVTVECVNSGNSNQFTKGAFYKLEDNGTIENNLGDAMPIFQIMPNCTKEVCQIDSRPPIIAPIQYEVHNWISQEEFIFNEVADDTAPTYPKICYLLGTEDNPVMPGEKFNLPFCDENTNPYSIHTDGQIYDNKNNPLTECTEIISLQNCINGSWHVERNIYPKFTDKELELMKFLIDTNENVSDFYAYCDKEKNYVMFVGAFPSPSFPLREIPLLLIPHFREYTENHKFCYADFMDSMKKKRRRRG